MAYKILRAEICVPLVVKNGELFNLFGVGKFILSLNRGWVVIIIRKYVSRDYEALVSLMEQLQDYLVGIDQLQRLRRQEQYGKSYTDKVLTKIEKEQGIIFLVKESDKAIGVIVGVIEIQTAQNLLECIPTKTGRIIDLYVDKEYRSRGIGILLMNKLESYFLKQKCTIIKVEVFVPNSARLFYENYGFHDRTVDMIKVL